jgi:hypothetical protein
LLHKPKAITMAHHPCEELSSIVKKRQDCWYVALPFDISAAGDGSHVVDILEHVGRECERITNLKLPPRYGPDHKGSLRTDIQKAAREAGFVLIITKGKEAKFVEFSCRRRKLYQNCKKTKASLLDDNKEGITSTTQLPLTKPGREKSRPATTHRPMTKECKCPFRFTLSWNTDKKHWFMRYGKGSRDHRFHDKVCCIYAALAPA